MPVVYVDVLFLTDFVCDFFLLYITGRIYKNKSPLWRICLGALVGGVYSVAVFFPNMNFFVSAVCKLMISLLIIFISFKIHSIRDFFALFMLFYLSGFVLGGISFALFFLTDFGAEMGAAMSNGVIYININPMYIFVGALMCYTVLLFSEKFYVTRLLKHSLKHTLDIYYKGRKINVNAIFDSGNFATDPVTNTAVIVCETGAALPLFEGESFCENLLKIKNGECDKNMIELVCDTPMRIVPYRSAGAEASVMPAFFPDKIAVDGKECTCSVLVGLCGKISDGQDGIKALLHPRIINRMKAEREVV